jgi:hypothetical protein
MDKLTLRQWLAERKAKGLDHSISWLARELEISTQAIHQWGMPSGAVLAKLERLSGGRLTALSFEGEP